MNESTPATSVHRSEEQDGQLALQTGLQLTAGVRRTEQLGLGDRIAKLCVDRVDEMQLARRMPADLAAEIAQLDAFRLLVPREFNGLEMTPSHAASVLSDVARVNASASWCVMIGATTGSLCGRMVSAGAREVFAGSGPWGGTYAPMGRATAVPGGWELTGSWQWGSGSQNCEWLAGGAVCEDGVIRLCFLPASECEISENWDVLGLEGTGSHDWSCEAVVVPEERCIDIFGGEPTQGGPLYQFPLFGLLASGVAAVALGIGQASLAAFAESAARKSVGARGASLADRGTTQAEFARCSAAIGSAASYLHAVLESTWDSVAEGVAPTVGQRAEIRLAASHAVAETRAVVESLYTLSGGSAVRRDSPMRRHLADISVLTQHLMVGPSTFELVGRVGLGVRVNLAEL